MKRFINDDEIITLRIMLKMVRESELVVFEIEELEGNDTTCHIDYDLRESA